MPQPHGTINRYNNQKCRCDLCRAAIREYRRTQRAQGKGTQPVAVTSHTSTTMPSLSSRTTPQTVGTLRCQVARASCGHLLWFAANVAVPLGGWVGCPQHRLSNVRDLRPATTIPTDALPGSILS